MAEATADITELGFSQDYKFAPAPGMSRKASRYIFFPGNVMSDKMKGSAEHLRLGGEYYGTDYPALAPMNFVLNRCRITPLTVRPRPIAIEESRVNPHEFELMNDIVHDGGTLPNVKLVRTFPNDAINGLVYSEQNVNGKIELTKLAGHEFLNDNGTINEDTYKLVAQTQKFFFPNWPEVMKGTAHLPKTLREIENMIRTAQSKTKESFFIETGDEMLEACTRFRQWGTDMLERDATRIRAGLHPAGYTHQYSDTAKTLLEQLEIQRESFTGQQGNQASSADLSAAVTLLAQNQSALTQMLAANQASASKAMGKKAEVMQEKAQQELIAA